MKHTKTRIYLLDCFDFDLKHFWDAFLIIKQRYQKFVHRQLIYVRLFFRRGIKSRIFAAHVKKRFILAMSVLSSPEIITAAENTAIQKISFSTRKTLTLAILAGIYIAMGGLLSLVIGYGFPEITTNNPGLQRLLSGAMFPLGLILVVFAGAELFTGNNAVLIPGLCNHK